MCIHVHVYMCVYMMGKISRCTSKPHLDKECDNNLYMMSLLTNQMVLFPEYKNLVQVSFPLYTTKVLKEKVKVCSHSKRRLRCVPTHREGQGMFLCSVYA